MRPFSRHIPDRPGEHIISAQKFLLALALALLVLLVISLAAAAIFLAFIGLTAVLGAFSYWRLRKLAAARTNPGICSVARSVDRRMADPWVIRAVHDEVQAELKGTVRKFPVLGSDEFGRTFWIRDEELEDLIIRAARRAGRSIEDTGSNPVQEIITVADLIHYLSQQPHAAPNENFSQYTTRAVH